MHEVEGKVGENGEFKPTTVPCQSVADADACRKYHEHTSPPRYEKTRKEAILRQGLYKVRSKLQLLQAPRLSKALRPAYSESFSDMGGKKVK